MSVFNRAEPLVGWRRANWRRLPLRETKERTALSFLAVTQLNTRAAPTWYSRGLPEMAVSSRAFAAAARVALALALAATLCVYADARRLDARHVRGAARDFRASGMFFEGPAYDGCCDGTDGVVLDCCRDGGCCPGDDGGFLDCCITTEGDNDVNVRSSRVFFEGPDYDGCCDVAEGEPLMECCTHGGCCPDGEGVALSCCASGTVRRASIARLGQGLFSDVRVADASRALGKRPTDASGVKASGTTKPSREDVSSSGAAADGSTVEHEVSPEVAFTPAEEADVNDPTYGAFARLDPGGESYYEKADETETANAAENAAEAEALAAVADAANDDSVDPSVSTALASGSVAAVADKTKRKKLHTRGWWERHAAHDVGGENVSWRAIALRGAASGCVVVWLTALAVSAVLKRADGRAEDERKSLL